MSQTELYKQEYVNAALNRYKYASMDDMYASVGFGAITPSKIISRMLEEYRKEHKDIDLEEKIEELSKNKRPQKKASDNGIVVKGIDNCLVKLSKCCNPVPGDEIIGYITKGRGVSVHRKDCINTKDLLNDESRVIDVAWYEESKQSSYKVEIEILANDRTGLMADIIQELSKLRNNILGINGKTNKDKTALIDIAIEVENLEELNKILRAIRKVDSVYEVNRKK